MLSVTLSTDLGTTATFLSCSFVSPFTLSLCPLIAYAASTFVRFTRALSAAGSSLSVELSLLPSAGVAGAACAVGIVDGVGVVGIVGAGSAVGAVDVRPVVRAGAAAAGDSAACAVAASAAGTTLFEAEMDTFGRPKLPIGYCCRELFDILDTIGVGVYAVKGLNPRPNNDMGSRAFMCGTILVVPVAVVSTAMMASFFRSSWTFSRRSFTCV